MSRAAGAPDGDDDLHSRLAASNGALQNLLRRLGTGMEDLLPSHGRMKMKELLAGLKDPDEGRQMEALNELCDVLSMGQEDILIGFNIDAFLPVLVELLNYEHNPEIMLLACRAITHLLEVLPKSAVKVVSCGAVPIFCQRLHNIEFIDVAEQSLLAMHKLSTEHPEPLLRANGLSAALGFIDFFDMNTQRTAAATAANMCRNIATDQYAVVSDMIPNITQLLSSDDQKIVESAVLCFVRLVESFASSEEQLQDIARHGMLSQLLRILRPRHAEGRPFDVSTGTYTSIVKTLALSCRGSSQLVVSLLDQGIIDTVHGIIRKEEDAELSGTALMTVVAVQRPVEQLLHTLVLANELLPPVEGDDDTCQFIHAIAGSSSLAQDVFGRGEAAQCLRDFEAARPEMLAEYAAKLYPILIDIAVTIVSEEMRVTCLAAAAKLVAAMRPEELLPVVRASQLPGYLSGFLSSPRPSIAGLALLLAEKLLRKLPKVLGYRFASEGVTHEVARLCAKEAVAPTAATDALLERARRLQATVLEPGVMAEACAESAALVARAEEVAKRLRAGDAGALEPLRALFCAGAGAEAASDGCISSYQLLTSGLAESLLEWLSSGEDGRIEAFARVVCGCKPAALPDAAAGDPPLRVLVRKLNEGLTLCENFAVVTSDATCDLTAGLRLLAQPLKLRLSRDAGDSSLADYGGNVVLIEPLATVNAVHDFLWPKVSGAAADEAGVGNTTPDAGSPDAGARARDREKMTAAAGGGYDDAPEVAEEEDGDDGDDDAADDVGVQASPGAVAADGGDSDGEDESAADVTRPTPSRPHDAKSGGGQDAGGGKSASGHSLVFMVDGQPLSYKCPVIQAIGGIGHVELGAGASASGARERSSGQGCRAAWDQVHVVSYRRVRPEDEAAAQQGGASPLRTGAGGAEAAGAEGGGALPAGEAALVVRVRDEPQAPSVAEGSDTLLILRLLRALNIINVEWQLLFDGAALLPMPMVAASEFTNVKLAWKLMRQLQDPLMLCTASLPRWCTELAQGYAFLFPLECREFFTSCTAFGISRALHSMQQRALGASNSDRPTEVRIGRIQREKIRVSRARILTSAMRALELYASHRSMLEVEYYGEAGTGLGPTLEFFTLVSQELQSARLGLWRDAGAAPQPAGAEEGAAAGAAAAEEERGPVDDGLGAAPVQSAYIRGFHHVCVTRCAECSAVTFPRCEQHRTLLTKRTAGGGGRCHQCEGAACEVGGACGACGAAEGERVEWWMLSDEEAAYLSSAFPAGHDSLDHMMLQCPECRSVNFPGTEQSLVVNRGGKMTSLLGSEMHEEDYRAVTRHVHSSCANLPLTQVPVRLVPEECAAAARLVGSTPEAEEGGEDAPRVGGAGTQYVSAPHGLYPAPLAPGAPAGAVLALFRFVGRLVAKALIDQRTLDLPLSPALLRTLVGRHPSLHDLAAVDPALFATLSKMRAALARGAPVEIDGCAVEDLCLDMTLPGHPDIELVPGGRAVPVTAENLGAYVEAVARVTLVDGVERQVAELAAGFNQVFPLEHLSVFSAEELETHIRGDVAPWDLETVRESVRPDHGYSEASPQVQWLVEFMASMGRQERRPSLRFITGSPTLPSGGLRRLNPRLTVVRKDAEAPLAPDDFLPSVMTCANYLKLPEYSSPDVLRRQLRVALQEGQLSFLLS